MNVMNTCNILPEKMNIRRSYSSLFHFSLFSEGWDDDANSKSEFFDNK